MKLSERMRASIGQFYELEHFAEAVEQLEDENRQLRRMMEVNAPDFPIDEALEKLRSASRDTTD